MSSIERSTITRQRSRLVAPILVSMSALAHSYTGTVALSSLLSLSLEHILPQRISPIISNYVRLEAQPMRQ